MKSDAVAGRKQSRRAGTYLRRLALACAAWSLLAFILAQSLVTRAELTHADALVVLSGAATYVERTRWAAQLYKQGLAPKIILTNDGLRGGWSSQQQRNPFFVERAAEELRRAGVPQTRIEVLPTLVSGTREEATLLHEYAATHNLRSLLFVTSAYHSRRALWTARRVFAGSGIEVGLDFVPAGQMQTPAPFSWWLERRGWHMVAVEHIKIIYYWIRHR